MMKLYRPALALFAFVVVSAGSAAAQEAQPPAGGPPKPPAPEPTLVFDREVFSYQAQNRRDPFVKLVGKNAMGPRFEDLSVKGIIYTGGAESVVLLTDAAAKKTYRLRRGDVVGNSRVLNIEPTRVTLEVENFGQRRPEILELKKKSEGA